MHPTLYIQTSNHIDNQNVKSTSITQREKEVLNLIAHEHSSKEIAEKLFVSHETVNSHRKNMMDKLGVRNAAGLVRVAFERGLMRVGQVACTILVLFSFLSEGQAQVTNGNKYNWQMRTTFYEWYQPQNIYDGQDNENYPTFLIKAAEDNDDEPTRLLTTGYNVDHRQDVCIQWNADIPTEKYETHNLLSFTEVTETDFDLDIVSYDRLASLEDAGYSRCRPQVGDLNYQSRWGLFSAITGNSSSWNESTVTQTNNKTRIKYETIWRYFHGNTATDPLIFDDISVEGTKLFHDNSNLPRPFDANSDMVYGNQAYVNDFQHSNDVNYQFEVAAGNARKIIISTDYSETTFSTMIHLLKKKAPGAPGNAFSYLGNNRFFGLNNNSQITADLSPGIYVVVVEGHSTQSGNFKLSVENQGPATPDGGTIKVEDGADLSLCVNVPFPNLESVTTASSGTAIHTLDTDNITYQWKMNTGNGYGNVSGTLIDLSSEAMRTMGDGQTVLFKRVATISGVEAESNELTFTFQSSTNNAGVIKYQDNKAVREGFSLYSDISNVTAADVLEGPGNGSPIYKWTKEIVEDEVITDIDGAMSNSLTPALLGSVTEDITIRRVSINDCESEAQTSPINIKAIKAEGFIGGKVTAPGGGAKIAGVEVCAVLDDTFGDIIDRHYANDTVCVITDQFGDYKIENLYTGDPNEDGLRYKVSASFLNHEIFKVPASAEGGDSLHVVILKNNETEDGKNFEDRTVISVQGNIHHDFNNIKYGKKGVKVFAEQIMNGVAAPIDSATTDASGSYAIALPNPGEYRIRPEYKRVVATSSGPTTQEHTFEPAQIEKEFFVNEEIDFIDESYQTIVLRYGGACDRSIGSCQIDIIDRDNFNKIKAKMPVNSSYMSLSVPARAYDIDILNENYVIGGGVDGSVVEGQLNTMPNDSAKVEFGVDSIAISIQEKPTVILSGFDKYVDGNCGDGTALHELPVLEQHKIYPDIKVEVFEGPGETCPLDTGTLQVVVGTATLPELPISSGQADGFLLKGGFPNFNPNYTMNMSISARDALNQNSELIEQSFVTTGSKSKGTDFVSLSPELPFLVLHDPPTDGGSAFWESSSGVSTTSTTYMNHSEGGGAWTALQVGGEFENGVSILGVTFSAATEAFALADTDVSAIHSTNSSESTNITTTITEGITTSADEDFIGDDADIVMTMIMTKTFSESDILEKDGCDVVLTTEYALSKDSISAISYRTIKDIREQVIPDLETIIASSTDPEETKGFEFSIKQWQDIIAANEEEKRRAFVDNPSDSLRHIAIGSGVDLDYSRGSETTYSTSFEYIMEVEEELAVGARLVVAGNGGEGRVYGRFRQEFTTEPTVENETTETITTGFSLSEDDEGDQYTIAVYKDSRYGTPMFNVIAGSSSCPYVEYNEENPIARTKLYSITADKLIENDVDPSLDAEFEFKIFNNSDGDIEFLLQKDFAFGQSSEVRINSSLDNLVAINVPPSGKDGSFFKVLVVVKRTVFSGPDNETIKVRIAPNCGESFPEFEDNNEELLTFTVNYASTISPVTMVSPTPNQIVNIASDNILKINMTDYDKANFNDLGLQYTKQGSGSLKDAINFAFTNEDFNNDAVLGTIKDWDLSEVTEDGVYDIKLKTTKDGASGSNGSEMVTILIDRQKPRVFGVPEPIDDHYDQSENDILSVSYNENIKASTSGVTVLIEDIVNGGAPIEATVTIYQNRVKIVENTAALNSLPASAYRVTLSGIEDMVGNPADTYRWVFIVGDFSNINLACISELFVNNNNLDQNSINVTAYKAKLISSDGVIDGYGTTTYEAEEEVNLNRNFEVTEGGVFEAQIEGCGEQ